MSKPKLEFKGLEGCSLMGWPGRMVAIAYTPGCNLRCPYCQNPGLIGNPDKLPTIKREGVLASGLLEEICDGIKSEFNKYEIRGV